MGDVLGNIAGVLRGGVLIFFALGAAVQFLGVAVPTHNPEFHRPFSSEFAVEYSQITEHFFLLLDGEWDLWPLRGDVPWTLKAIPAVLSLLSLHLLAPGFVESPEKFDSPVPR